jgi:hypothetical protein
MLWVAHRYTQARYQLPISTGHLQQYEANRQMLMEQLDAAATQYQRDHELSAYQKHGDRMTVFDECWKQIVAADCECPVRDDGVHCDCWWDDNKCCGCGAG